jgi:DNA-binding MarR family transcriptional regulator
MQKVDTTEDKIIIQHDEIKRKVLEALSTEKEHVSVSDISKKTGIARSKLFYHLNMLEGRKLVKTVMAKNAKYAIITDYGKSLITKSRAKR